MSENRVRAHARVRVVVEVDSAGGTWGPECTVEQVHRQAAEAAEESVRSVLVSRGFRIVEPPQVTIITHEVKR